MTAEKIRERRAENWAAESWLQEIAAQIAEQNELNREMLELHRAGMELARATAEESKRALARIEAGA